MDGTLAHYDGFKGVDHIGEPIAPMVERVKRWLAAGREVKIFTARMHGHGAALVGGGVADVKTPIQEWCRRHLGCVLEVTNAKDFGMVELWDDRCVQVEANTGVPVASCKDPEAEGVQAVRVISVTGEPTVLHVESEHLQCVDPECSRLYPRKNTALHVGSCCPKCGATLDVRFHRVDVENYNLNGECSCEWFGVEFRPKLRGMNPDEQAAGRCRCTHIIFARAFLLDMSLTSHKQKRYADARGQREENAA